MEANGIDISSLGTTTEDVKNSINEEEFTHTMVGVSNIELDMSYVPGMSVDDMTDKDSRKNSVTIGNKTIEIKVEPNTIPSIVDYEQGVNEAFISLFEVKDRLDDEDTTSAKRRERSNQRSRRAKEKSSNGSDSSALFRKKNQKRQPMLTHDLKQRSMILSHLEQVSGLD